MASHKDLSLSLKKRGGLQVTEVTDGSIADAVGISRGDRIASINGREIKDVIDYRYFSTEERLVVEVIKGNGEVWEVDLEKEPDEEIGLDFDPMRIRQCPNKCFFCFVDQNPQGQRSELYIRDEDYRFSFLFGNYITLTNLTKRDKARIFEQRLSPLYVSVHTTDPELRRFMLGNSKARPILDEIRDMIDHGIMLHAQVVLCPGVNDGKYLIQSIEDLVRFHRSQDGGIGSLAVVPVGMTGHRGGLYPIEPVTRAYARGIVEMLRPWQERFTRDLGYPFVFASDELFIKADLPFPPLSDYCDLPQLENGVGMVPLFIEEMRKGVRALPKRLSEPKTLTLVTGSSFFPYLQEALTMVKVSGLTIRPVAIRNDCFGHSVTVTGLLTGRDIVAQLKGHPLGDLVVIPRVTLNDRGSFLDDSSPHEVEEGLGVRTVMVEQDVQGLLNLLKVLP
jgi:putative radical SAM enzyme (TIGR03279 family)